MTGFLAGISKVESPNFSDRPEKTTVDVVVIHGTAGGRHTGSVSWLVNPQSRVSATFVIGRKGEQTQLVALDKVAWHAGPSEVILHDGSSRRDVNRYSIGIELANRLMLFRSDKGQFFYEFGGSMRPYRGTTKPEQATLCYENGVEVVGWWEPYPEEQLESLERLLARLSEEGYAEAVRGLIGHDEIALPMGTRKRDPGPLFPWARFGRPLEGPSEGFARRTWRKAE